MAEQNKKPTISDIAKAAGVSKTTVSRYLNGKFELMGADTRQRLKAVIELNTYRPSDVARSLRSKQSRMIGVVIADISTPFSSALISGIERTLNSTEYTPIFVNSENHPKKERENISRLLSKGADGLLINACSHNSAYITDLDCNKFPIVLLDRPMNGSQFDIVTSEVEKPIYELMYHLKTEGFTAPYLFTQELGVSATRQLRHDVFLNAAEDVFEIDDPVSFVRNIDISEPSRTENYIKDILKLGEPPAFIGVNTMTTLHIISAMKRLDVEIPHKAGVCGPDDWSWGQRLDWVNLIAPGITTYEINSEEIGKQAAELLLSRIDGTREEKREIVLSSKIIVRGSTSRHI